MEENGQRGCRHTVRRTAFVCAAMLLVLLIVSTALWFSGWPQRKAIAYAAREYLGVEVAARDIATYGSFRIATLDVFDSPAERAANNPTAIVRGLELDYTLRPPSGRYFPTLRIDSLQIVLDATNPGDTNYDFLLDLFEPSEDEPMGPKYLPRQVLVRNLSVLVRTTEAEAQLKNVKLVADIVDTEHIEAAFSSDTLAGHWVFGHDAEAQRIRDGALAITVNYANDTVQTRTLASFPEQLEADAQVDLQLAGAEIGLSAIAKTLRIYGSVFPDDMQDLLRFPIAFESIEVTDANIQTRIVDGRPAFPDATFAASVNDLRVGQIDHEYYIGDLIFDAQAQRGETNEASFQLALDQGQRLRGSIMGNAEAGELQVAIENWSPEEVREAAPVDFRSALDAVEYESAGGYASAKWSPEGYSIDATIQSHGAKEGDDPIRLVVAAQGGAEGAPLIEGTLGAKIGEDTIDAVINADSEEAYVATVTLAGVDPRRWAGFLAKASLPENVTAKVAGAIAVEAKADAPNAMLRPELTFTEVDAAGQSFETITVTGALAMDKKFAAVNGGELTAIADDVQTITLSDARLDFDTMIGAAQFAAKIDLYPFVVETDYADLYGEVDLAGPLTLNGRALAGPLTLTSSLFGYGDYGVPYGKTLEAAAQLALNTEDNTGTLANLTVAIPERATLSSPSVAFVLSPFTARGDTTFEANGALIVDMALLPEAEGTARGAAAFVIDPDTGFTANWSTNIDAPRFALPDQVAHIEQLAAQASGSYDGGVVGEGSVTAAAITAAGASLRNVGGAIVGTGDVVRIGGVTGTLFNGPVIADVSVGLFEENMPIYLSAQYDRIDLARLTEEVEPPQVRLTGIASGSATLQYSQTGLDDFTVHARSSENLSLDRETVEELIFREKILERFSTRQLEKILREFAGEAPQRPFDSGTLYLRLEEGRIRGTAELVSEKNRDLRGLNLIVDIAIDPEQLAETFVLLEKGELDRVEL